MKFTLISDGKYIRLLRLRERTPQFRMPSKMSASLIDVLQNEKSTAYNMSRKFIWHFHDNALALYLCSSIDSQESYSSHFFYKTVIVFCVNVILHSKTIAFYAVIVRRKTQIFSLYLRLTNESYYKFSWILFLNNFMPYCITNRYLRFLRKW